MNDDGFTQLGNGNHKVHVDGDFVIMRSFGVTMLDDLHALTEIYARIRREHGSLFVLYDGRAGTGLDRSVRKVMLQPTPSDVRPDAAASFGVAFSSRILMGMIDRALVAFGRKTSGVAMFETEAEARSYLAQERIRLKNATTR